MNNYLNQYQNTQVNTSSPEKLLIMLYDGAIRFISQAQDARSQGDQHTKREKISKAMAIISELSNTLDHEVGGEIAENLDALYNYMLLELMKGNLEDKKESLETVKNLLTDLLATWKQAIQSLQEEDNELNEAAHQSGAQPTAERTPLAAASY